MATETANTTATRAAVFHPSSSVGFPHPRQRDGGGRNEVGVADLVDGRNDGRRRRECLVFMSQLPNGGGDAQARRPERRDFKRQSFDQPRIARIGAERSAHHAHLSHNIAEKCESSSMRVIIPIIPMIYSTNSVFAPRRSEFVANAPLPSLTYMIDAASPLQMVEPDRRASFAKQDGVC